MITTLALGVIYQKAVREHPSTHISNTVLDIPQRSILRRRWVRPKRKTDLSVVGLTMCALRRCLSMILNNPATYIKNRNCPRQPPCGTLVPKMNASDMQIFIRILCFLWDKQKVIHFCVSPMSPKSFSRVCRRIPRSVAALRSIKTSSATSCRSILRIISFCTLNRALSVEWVFSTRRLRGVARGGFQGFWNPPFGLWKWIFSQEEKRIANPL